MMDISFILECRDLSWIKQNAISILLLPRVGVQEKIPREIDNLFIGSSLFVSSFFFKSISWLKKEIIRNVEAGSESLRHAEYCKCSKPTLERMTKRRTCFLDIIGNSLF